MNYGNGSAKIFKFSKSEAVANKILLYHASREKAGDILLIIGAGGAFGALIAQTDLAGHLAGNEIVGGMGIFFPFLVAAVLKTEQGSSSVAIVPSATMVLPVLPALGLDHETGKVFAVLAMGAGSMMVSHANDSFFWVISRLICPGHFYDVPQNNSLF